MILIGCILIISFILVVWANNIQTNGQKPIDHKMIDQAMMIPSYEEYEANKQRAQANEILSKMRPSKNFIEFITKEDI